MQVLLRYAGIIWIFMFSPALQDSRGQAIMNDSVAEVVIIHNGESMLNGNWIRSVTGYRKTDSTKIVRVEITAKKRVIRVYADRQLAYAPFREPLLDTLQENLGHGLEEPYSSYRIELFAGKHPVAALIPNYYRSSPKSIDRKRIFGKWHRKAPPLVRNLSRPWLDDATLFNTNIALWHSHGWYYEPSLNRWEWQRARLFQTVEDLYPMAYTLPFLIPMLENAGATTFVPRERDWQVNEVVVDNDGSTGQSLCLTPENVRNSDTCTGFGLGTPPYVQENPFRLGSYAEMNASREAGNDIQWIPDIPEEGDYAVYISYHASSAGVQDAAYRVYHAGGVTDFSVNQQMGGSTWVYLGRFHFRQGLHPEEGKVVLTNRSRRRHAVVTADAVRFGGGMGNIARNGLTGNRPRYQEAARYYLQYAGMPDSLVWKLNDTNDYNDDYQSRGEWVNYLMGAPSGPNADRSVEGLHIPVDLSLAFHTDAGISDNDTVIGTLGIYSTTRDGGYFPGGLSRMASRDLTDLVQTQIVDDIRALYDPAWTRRGMWDKEYSEAYRPHVPAMLLELFSHQNFLDIRFGQEPMFRFDVSRAIYKGMLRFMHAMYGIDYVVQPLPVDHFSTSPGPGGEIVLSWKPRHDPLEPTAEAESYIVYTRLNEEGFDNGIQVTEPRYILASPHPGTIYSFKVTAVNRGGESFPSEILAAGRAGESSGTVLVVNAFDRVSGPAWFDDEHYAGFLNVVDQGVPYGVDLHTVGEQFDYLKSSPWLDDDSPGHGASYADLEAQVIPGNTFDFSYIHGSSMLQAGYSFFSVSDESVLDDSINPDQYDVLDYLAGEELSSFLPGNDSVPRYAVFPGSMLNRLGRYLENGGHLFLTGAHIATDVHLREQDSLVASLLKYTWRTSNASRLGEFYFMDPAFGEVSGHFTFQTRMDPHIYMVEGADALEPADSTAITLARYAGNNMSAGVAWRGRYGVVVLGFPFETIREKQERDLIMKRTISYLLGKNDEE